MIKLLVNEKEVAFKTTQFPDGTSQVWQIADNLNYRDKATILWLYENDAEIFHVAQLAQLLHHLTEGEHKIYAPFLPYGRQDKGVTNNSTFALFTLDTILSSVHVQSIKTYDAHSTVGTNLLGSIVPVDFHTHAFKHDVACFPDKGAVSRYSHLAPYQGAEIIHFDKVRDQLTGNITGLQLIGNSNLENKTILIVDDICDAGMTFIKVAEALNKFKPKQIDLAVSHGLFTKGKQCLHDAGISNIYTTNSLLRNPEGFKVW